MSLRLGAKSNDDFAVGEKQVNRLITVIRRNAHDKLLGKADADGEHARAAFGIKLAQDAVIKTFAAPEPPQSAVKGETGRHNDDLLELGAIDADFRPPCRRFADAERMDDKIGVEAL